MGKKVTAQDIRDFEYELAHLQNKYGIFIEAENEAEWDEDIDGNYEIISHVPYIVYKDIDGNEIDIDSLEKMQYYLLKTLVVTKNEAKLMKFVNDLFKGKEYTVKRKHSLIEFIGDELHVFSHSPTVSFSGEKYGRIYLDSDLRYTEQFINKCRKVWKYEYSPHDLEVF